MGTFYRAFAITTILVAILVYQKPELVPERFSRAVVRFLIYDIGLAGFYYVFIYPFFFNPLRHIPGPTVRTLLSHQYQSEAKMS